VRIGDIRPGVVLLVISSNGSVRQSVLSPRSRQLEPHRLATGAAPSDITTRLRRSEEGCTGRPYGKWTWDASRSSVLRRKTRQQGDNEARAENRAQQQAVCSCRFHSLTMIRLALHFVEANMRSMIIAPVTTMLRRWLGSL
jgi:hypothetical protein